VRLAFSELEYVYSDCYFTEGSVVLAFGKYNNEQFYLQKVLQPPLLKNKPSRINEVDHFGAYSCLA
jgi:hypothetical protein